MCTYKRYQFKIQLLRQLNHSIRYILYLRSFCGHIALKALQRNVHASICCVPTNLCHCLLDSSTLPLTSAVPPSFLPCRLFIRSSCSKALIAHLVSISGLSADNWSITPPKSRNRRRKAAAMFRRTATLAKHGRARLSLEPRPNGARRRDPPFGKLAPPPLTPWRMRCQWRR